MRDKALQETKKNNQKLMTTRVSIPQNRLQEGQNLPRHLVGLRTHHALGRRASKFPLSAFLPTIYSRLMINLIDEDRLHLANVCISQCANEYVGRTVFSR